MNSPTELGDPCVGLFTDPGSEHTGFVIVKMERKLKTFQIVAASEVNGFVNSADLIPYAVQQYYARLWVYEGFRLYEHKAFVKVNSELEEVQTIGAMRLAATKFPHLVIHKQFAVQIKVPPFSDRMLREIGVDLAMMPSGHTRDAFRHFMYFWCHVLKFGYPKVDGTRGHSK